METTQTQTPITRAENVKTPSFLTRKARDIFLKFLPPAVTLNGSNDQDIRVHDERLYPKVLFKGSMGLGEAYVDGWWDCNALDQFFTHVINPGFMKKLIFSPPTFLYALKQKIFNLQKRKDAFKIAEHHYDLGNDLYRAMLDPLMVYTCAYWKDATTLDAAQEAKLDLVCRKLQLKSGMTLLDIGCGWGGLAKHAARNYGAKVLGVTVSKEQVEFAKESCQGLSVDIRLQDYRDVKGEFDRVVSVGCLEHVGPKNYRTYMKTAHRSLKQGGVFVMHSIGLAEPIPLEPWIISNIFPAGSLPIPRQIAAAAENLFDFLDLHEFGSYYDPTLMAWFENFDRNWPALSKQYDERFYRMWKYYLLCCAGLFRSGLLKLYQVVLGKGARGYVSVR